MKVLILSNNEITYNPRLLKAADFLSENGVELTIFNPITGIAGDDIYYSTTRNKGWKLIENDISKRTILSYLNWLWISLIHKLLCLIYKYFRLDCVFDKLFNKGLIGNKINLKIKYDYVLINLIDNLPYAVKLKRINCKKIIYDSQEYFVGQYQKYEKKKLDWVIKAEKEYIKDVDILLATTNVMLEKIIFDYNLNIPTFRVRNVPSKQMLRNEIPGDELDKSFKWLVWHGMTIHLNNTRGVHILVEAVAKCRSKVKFVIQGSINESQRVLMNQYILKYNLNNKIIIKSPANPYSIVSSLRNYDIGLIGEIPEEENQILTSSNKLFDFINAGLAVVAPDLPGLNETINTYNLGLKYQAGNSDALAEVIDGLIENEELLQEFKRRAIIVAQKELYWEYDFENVWRAITNE